MKQVNVSIIATYKQVDTGHEGWDTIPFDKNWDKND